MSERSRWSRGTIAQGLRLSGVEPADLRFAASFHRVYIRSPFIQELPKVGSGLVDNLLQIAQNPEAMDA